MSAEAQIRERKIRAELAQLGCTPEQIAKHVAPLQRNADDSELAKYNAACRAVAEAKATDEVMLIHDQARALAAAAKIAKNRQLEIDAAEIRIRATRRLGQMMEEGKQDRAGHGGDRKSKIYEKPLKPTLKEIGIDKSLAHRARRLATHPEKKVRADGEGVARRGDREQRPGVEHHHQSVLDRARGESEEGKGSRI